MATKKSPPARAPREESGGVAPKLQGRTFVLTGKIDSGDSEEVARQIKAEGGRVAAEVGPGVDYLVIGWPKRGLPSEEKEKAARRHKALGDALRIIGESEFHALFVPTKDEALALLTAGPAGRQRWGQLATHWRWTSPGSPRSPDLRGANFRGADLRGVEFDGVALDGSDFSGADLTGAHVVRAENCTFDGATLHKALAARCKGCSFRDADLTEGTVWYADGCTFDGARITNGSFSETIKNCTARNADLSDTRLNPADVSGCDFTGAKLCRVWAGLTKARGAVFRGADLSGAKFGESRFEGANFTGATLSGANFEGTRFEEADFTGADLSKADLSKCHLSRAVLRRAKLAGADLRKAKLAGADLTGADLTGANLADADLTGATIDGADFQGAYLNGARLKGLDPAKARNLTRERLKAGGALGPHLRALGEAARAAARLETRVELDLPDGESVRLIASGRQSKDGHRAGAYFNHETPGVTTGASVDAPTFERGMLNLAKKWFRGRLRPESVAAEASKSPVCGPALRELATAAWLEALGLPVPAPEDLRRQIQAQEANREARRDQMRAELLGGKAGVKAWNARPFEERHDVGPLRRLALAGAELSRANLTYTDLTDANLDGARLARADLCWAHLKGASFRHTDLTGAECRVAHATRAVFEGASLTRCVLERTNFTNADFRNADLRKADLRDTNLRGADFTGANLEGAKLRGASYNEQTRWPLGFVPPAEMKWKGKGKAPGAGPKSS